jgi:cytochrome P450
MTLDPVKHKRRRELLNPSFSKRRVNMLEHVMYDEIEKVFSRISKLASRGEIIPIQEAYYCYTVCPTRAIIIEEC